MRKGWNFPPARSVARVLNWLVMSDSLRGSSVHGIFQARILEWVAISSSRRCSQPRDPTLVSGIGRGILYHWATREAPLYTLICHGQLCGFQFCVFSGSRKQADPALFLFLSMLKTDQLTSEANQRERVPQAKDSSLSETTIKPHILCSWALKSSRGFTLFLEHILRQQCRWKVAEKLL